VNSDKHHTNRSVALIPARSGSKRIKDKNIRSLGGHPLMAYTVCAAINSNVFDAVICATDSQIYADVANHYGAETPFLRAADISGDKSPDIEWVEWILNELKQQGRSFDSFSILRPTNPFRLPETIRLAWSIFNQDPQADSLRAVSKCKEHPGKIWVTSGRYMLPVMPFYNVATPWHSSQYSALPEMYIQNASLEFAWCSVVLEQHSISGEVVIPFVSQGFEGFDINDPEDWMVAENYLETQKVKLPDISQTQYIIHNK